MELDKDIVVYVETNPTEIYFTKNSSSSCGDNRAHHLVSQPSSGYISGWHHHQSCDKWYGEVSVRLAACDKSRQSSRAG